MVRLKKLFRIRNFVLGIGVLLFIIIWLNYGNSTKKLDEDGREHFPAVLPMDETSKLTPHIYRAQRLYDLSNRHHLDKRIVLRLMVQQGLETTPKPSLSISELNDDGETTKIQTNQPEKPARYFVNSHKCKMPFADPFSKQLLEIYTPSTFKSCSNETDLFTLDYDREKRSYKLHVNGEIARGLVHNANGLVCKYREVTRGINGSGELYSEIQPEVFIQQDVVLPQNLTGIIVYCHDALNTSKIVQQDAFSLLHPQVQPTGSKDNNHQQSYRKPSVIMLGLDSMSRINFQRTMPKTAKFVRQLGWYEMEGYNKVGENTFPNLMTVLTGHRPQQLKPCASRGVGCADLRPWIWKDYKRSGYFTALGEDVTQLTFFLDDYGGFAEVPVDHYLRTLLVGLQEVMRVYNRFGYHYCIGRRLSLHYLYDFCRMFVQRYVEEQDQPVFGFFWSQTFTHDFYFGATSLDAKYLEYLKLSEAHQLFERAVVIFFSDHGSRYGDLMALSDGFLEERLPMLHIYLPPWFRSTYPKYAQALQTNRNRLSSNYDLHNTLRHILQLNATTPDELPELKTCPTSQSLLHSLPQERSCEDACISEHWCTCNEFIRVPLDADVYYLGKLIVYHINRWILLHRFNLYCQRLMLLDLEHVERKFLFEEKDRGTQSMYGAISVYHIRFRTYPSDGQFQATVRYDRKKKEVVDPDIVDISRLNSYHNDSLCVEDKTAKKFCFCYPTEKGEVNSYHREWMKMNLSSTKKKKQSTVKD